MKRWTFRILLFLILGVVTTVGVAWGLADINWMLAESQVGQRNIDGRCWQVQRWESATAVRILSRTRLYEYDPTPDDPASLLPSWGGFNIPDDSGSPLLFSEDISARGWPMWAMYYRFRSDMRESSLDYGYEIHWQSADDGLQALRFPLRPIFPGFIINTLFYTAIWFGIFFGVATLRRFVRKKRGRCVKCGYDLRGQRSAVRDQNENGHEDAALTSDLRSDAGCPECGWEREA